MQCEAKVHRFTSTDGTSFVWSVSYIVDQNEMMEFLSGEVSGLHIALSMNYPVTPQSIRDGLSGDNLFFFNPSFLLYTTHFSVSLFAILCPCPKPHM